MRKTALVLSLVCLTGPAAAQLSAQQQETMAAARGACKADAQQYCAGVTPGGGALAACFKKNWALLSLNCKGELAALKNGHRTAPPAGE